MQASLARRYFGKLFANFATVPMYLVMEAILPRALGPKVYGDFNFATSVFTQFAGFLDMGTSTCFYNALSRRQQEYGLVAFYGRVSLIVLLITLGAGALLLFPTFGDLLLPNVPLWYGPMAALFGFLLWGTRVVRSMNDALGLTVPGEIVRSVFNLFTAALLLLLFFFEYLNDKALFLLQDGIMIGTILGCLLIMRRSWSNTSFALSRDQRHDYIKEFTDYSAPLFIQALLMTISLLAERWLLQWFCGSAEQGYFALSQRFSMACFMFVSAMTPLIMRELAIDWGRHDVTHMGQLLSRFAPMLFGIAAWFACFTVIEASTLVSLFGGAKFAAALIPVQIMAFYPAHQAYGQLASSVFHATGKTKTLRNLAFFEHIGGFILVWICVAPSDMFGLDLGATGLAIKTVITQAVIVNVLLYLASRVIPLRFLFNLFLQLVVLISFLALAWSGNELSTKIFTLLFHVNVAVIPRFIVSGIIYTIFSCILLFLSPRLFGCTHQDLRNFLARFKKRINP